MNRWPRQLLGGWLNWLPHAQIYGHIVAVVLGFALITYFHVVAGELVPKSLALRRAEALAVAIAPPMLVFMAVTRPAVRLLSRSAAVILRGFDIPKTERAASIHSAEELKLIATAARRLGLLPEFQETLVHRALELGDVPVREIMTPRQKIFSLPSNMLLEEACSRRFSAATTRAFPFMTRRAGRNILWAPCMRATWHGCFTSARQRLSPATPAG